MSESPLQTAPASLLAALELKVSGKNPNAFSDTLQPVADVYDQYLTDRVGVATESTTVVAPAVTGNAAEAPVTGVAWRVLAVYGFVVTAAGADAAIDKQVKIAIVDPGGVTVVIGRGESSLAFTQLDHGLYLPRPFWLPHGFSIQAIADLATAPAANWIVGVRVLVNRILE